MPLHGLIVSGQILADLLPLLSKMLEYAPAVAVLIYIEWRQDQRLGRCVDAMLDLLRHEQER
jgi:hypothetical protein